MRTRRHRSCRRRRPSAARQDAIPLTGSSASCDRGNRPTQGAGIALAGGYFAYFAAAGVFMPYFTPYLAARGWSATLIGQVMACYAAARVIGPLGHAWLADRVHDRRRVLQVATVLAGLAFALLTEAQTPWLLGLWLVLFSWCWNALVPVYDAHTLACLGGDAHRYGHYRYWGSVGFVVTAFLAGVAIDRAGTDAIPALILGCIAVTALVMLLLPAAVGTDGEAERGPLFRGVLDNPALLTFLTISFLLQVSFGAYYNFFTIYLAGYGHDASTIGALWATGVVAEIAVFIASPWLLARFRLSALLIVALVGTAVRWTLLAALPESVPVLVMAQSLHLAGFGLFHLVAVLLLPRLLPAGQGTRAQALNSSLGWGAGGIAGSLLSGWIWDAVGPRTAYVAATMVVLLALSLAVPGMTRAAVDGAGAGRTA